MKKVDFITACKSGKRFRQDSEHKWLSINDKEELVMHSEGTVDDLVPTLYIIKGIYELEEKEITITESEFDEAMPSHLFAYGFLDTIKDKLGF